MRGATDDGVDERGARVAKMLTVVEDEQDLHPAQAFHDLEQHGRAGALPNLQRAGDVPLQEGGFGET